MLTTEELWMPVVDFVGIYEVSSLGRVRSLARVIIRGKVHQPVRERILKNTPMKIGYVSVTLYRNGVSEKKYVHILVWTAFKGAVPPNLEINHIDGNKANPILINLETGTHQHNIQHAISSGLWNPKKVTPMRGELNGNAKLANSAVVEIKNELKNNKRVFLIATERGVSIQTIYRIKRGTRKK